jgi:phage protein D
LNLSTATYKILYDNKNITKDISSHLVSLTYTDKVCGESDELELSLEDADLLWQNAWYPQKGALLYAEIEQDGLLLKCGTFTIDEIEMTSSRGSGDTVTIKALAAGITKKLRTKRSTAHENKSLREIANSIAAANGLTVQGTIENIIFERVTQFEKTDLSFLQTLANDYGYTFSIRDNILTFTSIYDLEGRNHVLTIDKTDLVSWSLKDKTNQVYKQAKVKQHNPNKNETIDYEAFADDPDFSPEDILELKTKAENKQQAGAKAKSHLHNNNSKESEGSVAMPGSTLLVAGNNFELTGMGTLSGIQHIVTSSHTIDRAGGYITSCDVKRVKKIAAAKHKPKGKK